MFDYFFLAFKYWFISLTVVRQAGNIEMHTNHQFTAKIWRCVSTLWVFTTISLKLSMFALLLSVLWISSLWRLIPLTFTSCTNLDTHSNRGNTENHCLQTILHILTAISQCLFINRNTNSMDINHLGTSITWLVSLQKTHCTHTELITM